MKQEETPLDVMGCKQSRIIEYSELTSEDAKMIPQVFRSMDLRSPSPGVAYWLHTCFVQEGTMPLDVDAGDSQLVNN